MFICKKIIILAVFFFLQSNLAFCVECRVGYQAKIYDALLQWGYPEQQLDKIKNLLQKEKIDKAGIFLKKRKNFSSEVNIASSLLDQNGSFFFKGTPKELHYEFSLNRERIDALIKEIKRGKYKFLSEIMYRHADKELGWVTPAGERYINPLSDESVYLFSEIQKLFPKLPAFIHWEFYKWEEDFPKFSKLFELFPKQVFIINHLGFGSQDQVLTLIKKYKNVFFTISKKETFFQYFKNKSTSQGEPLLDKNGKINSKWKNILRAHSDRFIFATDSHKNYMWKNYAKIVCDYRKILGSLPRADAEKIAYRNAEKIFNLSAE